MKAAICSRVTGSEGQNRSLAGGLQPFVTPASASQEMSAWKTFESGTSVNWWDRPGPQGDPQHQTQNHQKRRPAAGSAPRYTATSCK